MPCKKQICDGKERAQMKAGKAVRVALDVALTIMIVFEMLIQFTGEFLHEVVGFAFFATVVIHIALSAAWVKKTAKNAKAGKLTARRTALAVIGSLLAVTTVVLGVSSVAISGILSSAGFVWPVGSYVLWASAHTFSAYALCALVVVHLAMHWAFLASAFKVPYNPSRRRAIATGVNAVAAVGVLALGATAVGKIAPQEASATGETGEIEPTSATGKSHKKGSSSSTANSGSGSSASGICTLCRKQCPLSAPKCDKPYEAGLL